MFKDYKRRLLQFYLIGKVIDTCIAERQAKCWWTYHTTQLPYEVIQLTCVHLTYTNQLPAFGEWMSWSRRGQGKAGEKYIFVSFCNLSGQRLETKEWNIPECSRRFKQLAFLRLTLSRDLVEIHVRKNCAVLPVWVAQWIKKTILEFFNHSCIGK